MLVLSIGKRNQRVHTSLVQIEGVANKEEAQYYLGKVRDAFLSTSKLRENREGAMRQARECGGSSRAGPGSTSRGKRLVLRLGEAEAAYKRPGPDS